MLGFLLDLDGTLYNGDLPIPGAAAFIERLRQNDCPYLYVTNNSSRTPQQVADHLVRTGITASADEVLTSSQAAALYLQDAGKPIRHIYAVGEDGLRQALGDAGFPLLGSASEPGEADTPDTASAADAVVQGIDRSFTYDKLRQAVRHLRGGASFILTNPDHLLPWNGELTPGAGSIAASIERASGVTPVVIGKPSPIIMNYAIRRLGLPAQQIWAVGDNLSTDIRGGSDAGCRTALVLTGLVSEAEAETQIAAAGVRPDLVCRDLPALADALQLK